MDLTKKFMHILFPPRCPFCDEILFHSIFVSREFVCDCCRNKPEYIKEPVCYKCGKPIADKQKEYCYDCEKKRKEYIQGKALWIYKDEVRESLYRFKYCNRREYALYYGLELVSVYGEWIKKCGIQAIIPIPLSKRRMRQRGFNQAALVANEIGKRMKIPVYHNLLIRVLDTKAQKELNEEERKNNLKKAFKTSVNKVQLDHILLIDDIYTTGSTMNEATRTLKQAGIDQIYCLSISIGRGY